MTKPKTTTIRKPTRSAAAAATTSIVAPADPQGAPTPTSKTARVFALLQREEGATLAELVEATGWLPHTTRAALTGLRKKGHAIEKSKRGETTCYRIADGGDAPTGSIAVEPAAA